MNEVARMYEAGEGGKKDKVSSHQAVYYVEPFTAKTFKILSSRSMRRWSFALESLRSLLIPSLFYKSHEPPSSDNIIEASTYYPITTIALGSNVVEVRLTKPLVHSREILPARGSRGQQDFGQFLVRSNLLPRTTPSSMFTDPHSCRLERSTGFIFLAFGGFPPPWPAQLARFTTPGQKWVDWPSAHWLPRGLLGFPFSLSYHSIAPLLLGPPSMLRHSQSRPSRCLCLSAYPAQSCRDFLANCESLRFRIWKDKYTPKVAS